MLSDRVWNASEMHVRIILVSVLSHFSSVSIYTIIFASIAKNITPSDLVGISICLALCTRCRACFSFLIVTFYALLSLTIGSPGQSLMASTGTELRLWDTIFGSRENMFYFCLPMNQVLKHTGTTKLRTIPKTTLILKSATWTSSFTVTTTLYFWSVAFLSVGHLFTCIDLSQFVSGKPFRMRPHPVPVSNKLFTGGVLLAVRLTEKTPRNTFPCMKWCLRGSRAGIFDYRELDIVVKKVRRLLLQKRKLSRRLEFLGGSLVSVFLIFKPHVLISGISCSGARVLLYCSPDEISSLSRISFDII